MTPEEVFEHCDRKKYWPTVQAFNTYLKEQGAVFRYSVISVAGSGVEFGDILQKKKLARFTFTIGDTKIRKYIVNPKEDIIKTVIDLRISQ